MMKFYKHGKDAEGLPCIELDDGTLITEPEILLALIKALICLSLLFNRHCENLALALNLSLFAFAFSGFSALQSL